ncbi:hypothetical protein G7Y89_g11323 [Cudoniella acicularis]|uniref:Uncharacterized protein n=1 Tax=Cudoniella acicularis TaxID=354080 RepID=A0A8H4VXY6_9HELO|nr:hypothetical protein G7Y89_g11323 [Cudoniella acicularis]
MFRRNSSKRLSRSKSTSSVHSKHESIDPEVARQHAHAAATLAFARAQERRSADLGHSGIKPRKHTSNQTERLSLSYLQSNSSDDGEQVIKRQTSVRFAGPNAVHRRQSVATRSTNTSLLPKTSSTTLRGVAITTNTPVPAAYRPPSRSSSLGKASISKTTAESFVTALAEYDELYNREQEIITTPSSYRRLRKSKSMLSPLKPPHVFYSNGTPDGAASSYLGRHNSISDSRTPQSQQSHNPLRAPKSMSFLRGGRGAAFRQKNDEAVQMARDRFFHQASQQRLREQPSFLFRSRAQKQDKPFRKSVRSSSGNSQSLPVASENQSPVTQPKEPGLRDKARKASKTIKIKLKRVLGLIKDEPVSIPNQQVDAHETHVREYAGGSVGAPDTFSDIPYPDETSLSRVASRNPSIRIHGSNEQLRSHAGSVRSFRSEHSDEGSRVTSWTSTAANTVTSQGVQAHINREQQRLSIINENGTHISSSSLKRSPLPNQFSAYPKIQQQSRSTGYAPPPVPAPVNSARVYSALMKRLDENNPRNNLASSHKGSVESLTASRHIPRRSGSFQRHRENHTPATIRHVPHEYSSDTGESQDSHHNHQWVKHDSFHSARAEDVFGYTGTHVHQWVPADSLRQARMRYEDDVFSPKISENPHDIPNMDGTRPRAGSSTSTIAISRQPSTKTSFYTVPEDSSLTPQEMAILNEPIVQDSKSRLRESRSTFFGGTQITVTRTTSPFRRAMAGDYNPAVITGETPVPTSNSPTRTHASRKSEDIPNDLTDAPNDSVEDDQKSQKAYSASLYSRTTSGQTPAATNSSLSLLADNEPNFNDTSQTSAPGDVIIIDRSTYRSSMPSGGGHRASGSAGSNEWKTWMSSEVAKLERGKENRQNSAYVNYAMPTMPKSFQAGHVRESAQIDDEDTEVSPLKVAVAKQPLGLVQQHPNIPHPPVLKPILKNRSQVSLFENGGSTNGSTISIPIPPPPPIPVRSPLRTTQSRASLRSNNTIMAPSSAIKMSSMSGRNLLHKRHGSNSTLRSVKSMETPAKLVKKHGRRASTISTRSPGGIGAAVEKQFGSTSTGSRTAFYSVNRQNENFSTGMSDEEDLYGVDGAGLMGPFNREMSETDAQALGSKRMVELFLSSRRRRIAGGSEDSGAFI